MTDEVTKASLADFLSRKPYSVIHIDASWDGYRQVVAERIRALDSEFQSDVSFGCMDSDAEEDYAREIGLLNVPSLANYRGSSLVALVIGLKQNIAQNIKRMQRGEILDASNRLSRG